MDSLDLQVLQQARDWRREGRSVWLVTVVETWGSAPRPPGALLALRDDGLVVGSVSGGCVEDDLIERVRKGERVGKPSLVTYGISKEEAARFGLPCGGTLRLVQEALRSTDWIADVLARTARHELVARHVLVEPAERPGKAGARRRERVEPERRQRRNHIRLDVEQGGICAFAGPVPPGPGDHATACAHTRCHQNLVLRLVAFVGLAELEQSCISKTAIAVALRRRQQSR